MLKLLPNKSIMLEQNYCQTSVVAKTDCTYNDFIYLNCFISLPHKNIPSLMVHPVIALSLLNTLE